MLVGLYLIMAKASGLLSEGFPLVFVGLGILSLYFVGWKATLKKRSEKSLRYAYGQDDLAVECSCVLALIIMFAFFFQDLHRQFSTLFVVGGGVTYLHWLVFTLENVFESIFDVFSLYGIHISGIEPNDNVVRRVILFFRFTVNVGMLILIVRNARNIAMYWQGRKKRWFWAS